MLSTLLLLALAQTPECKADKDCVVISATCAGFEIHPKGKVKEREKELKTLRANTDCLTGTGGTKPVAMCVMGRCMEKPTRVPGVDTAARCASSEMSVRGVMDLQRTCKVDQDCRLHDLGARVPAGCMQAFNTSADVASLLRYLDVSTETCGGSKPKCALLVNQAFCDGGICSARFRAGGGQK